MKKTQLLLGLSLLLALAGMGACSGAAPRAANPAAGNTPRPAGAPTASAVTTAGPAPNAPSVAAAERPPPPSVTAPMAGAPSAAVLAEARLVTSTCENQESVVRARMNDLIQQMRAEVDAGFESWRESQPGCWEEYRQRDIETRTRIRNDGTTYGWGSGAGQSMSSGGGLGNIGTRAHSTRTPKMSVAKAKSASGTNNQVAGVDEADIVKHDGRYVYVAMNGALFITEALEPRMLSVTKFPGKVRELFVEGDRAVLYVSDGGNGAAPCSYGYDCEFAGDGSSTTIVVLDVANRSAPKIARKLELSGSLMAARRIGNAVHTVVADGDAAPPAYSSWPDGLDTCGTLEAAVRAKFKKLKLENERKIRASFKPKFPTLTEGRVTKSLCERMYRTRIGDGEAFTTLVSFDLQNDALSPASATLQSRPGAVFASGDALYLSVVHRGNGKSAYSFYGSEREVSDIHKFRIGADPKATTYLGSGVVPGHVLNQFAMDEWYGYLRVATSRGRVPDPNVDSVISVLAQGDNGNLVRVGAIEKIAPGEDIRSVRFDGDRGYIVTFKKTDPLFVLDLYQPQDPRILGELKIPGFSTYIHRIDPNHLLSIGFDADDMGSFAYFDGVILQLFDVTQPTEPKLLHKEKIGTRGSSSEAATNHLAFNYFAEKGLLAIPMTICEGGGNGSNGNELAFSGLLVYDVSVERGFKKLGGIDHGTRGANCSTWWSKAASQVKRSIFLDDLVYSLATDRMKVQKMNHFGTDIADFKLNP